MKIIVFDLDDTLAESKCKVTRSMSRALKRLLKRFDVAVISGGAWPQFQSQLVSMLTLTKKEAKRLYLFPTSGTSFYRSSDGKEWKRIYCESLAEEEVRKITGAFNEVLANPGIDLPEKTWGDRIENRGTQVTFSAMGQEAPVEEKKKWDPTFGKRLVLIEKLLQLIPEFDIKAGGSTSIDVTRKGVDKGYGILQMEKHLGINRRDILFVGDALFPGGNDYAVKQLGVKCIETSGPEHTYKIIEDISK
jgi:phosphomannomutase